MNVLIIGNSMGYQCYHYIPLILNKCKGSENIHFEALYMRGARLDMYIDGANTRLTKCINYLDKITENACNVLYKYTKGQDKLDCTKMPDTTITELICSKEWDQIYVVPNTDCLYKKGFKVTLKKYVDYIRSKAPSSIIGYIQPSSEYTCIKEVIERFDINRKFLQKKSFDTIKSVDEFLDSVEKDALEYCNINLVLHARSVFNVVKSHPKMHDRYEMTKDLHHVDDCLGLYVMSLITYWELFKNICPCDERKLYIELNRPLPNQIDGTPARSVTKVLARRSIVLIKRALGEH